MKDLSQVVRKPLVTERFADLRERDNKFIFEVHPDANKHEIRQAIEHYFGVKVTDVRTMNVRGKVKRLGRFSGKRADWKKAIVTLSEGDSIDLFDQV
ncbi:50S ribosomal protein L23 [bacterium]|jgi:large subunit ribosomal protein L23|nr:50S ribosomal protein L23 [bacterium]